MDPDGIEHNAKCEIYVHIPNGVYRIKNAYNDLYLGVKNGGAEAGTEIIQTSGSSTSNDLSVLFKITFLGTCGNPKGCYYNIRPMTNSALGISLSSASTGANITLQPQSTIDHLIYTTDDMKWNIKGSGTRFLISHGYNSNHDYLSTPSNNVVGSCIVTENRSVSRATWRLEPYTGNPIVQITIKGWKEYHEIDTSYKFTTILHSSLIGVNGPVTYSVEETDGSITYKATIDEETGELRTKNIGEVKVLFHVSGASNTWYVVIKIEQSPNPNAQNKTNWCWAATAKMVGEHNGGSGALPTGATKLTDTTGVNSKNAGRTKFYGYSYDGSITVDAGQHYIVKTICGDDGNHTAIKEKTAEAMHLAAKKSVTTGIVGDNSLSVNDISTLKSELLAGRWVLVCLEQVGTGKGHAIVAKSYTQSTDKILLWDPDTDEERYISSGVLDDARADYPFREYDEIIECIYTSFIYCR